MSATRLDTPLDPEVVAIALADPLVRSSAVVRVVSVETESGSVDMVATTTDPLLDARTLLEGNPEDVVRKMKEGAILLSEPLAARLDVDSATGTFPLLTPDGWGQFPVAGVYADYASTRGTIRVDIDVNRSLWKDNTLNGVLHHSPKRRIKQNYFHLQKVQTGITPDRPHNAKDGRLSE